MNATQYMAHWTGKNVWKRLAVPVHQQRFQACVNLSRGSSFIDVGCALGHSTDYMAKMRPGAWTGMDFDPVAVTEARKRFPQYEFFFSADYDMALAGQRIVLTTPNKPVHDHGHLRCYTVEMPADLLEGQHYVIRRGGRFWYVTVDVRPAQCVGTHFSGPPSGGST
ncbi:MAG: hypothetical protein WC583_02770 [Candidatus Omnitrophota bacterium]|jgi:trans-aconitate methyltransferase|nr:hypothetical protein [Sphaerochaeta sp.]